MTTDLDRALAALYPTAGFRAEDVPELNPAARRQVERVAAALAEARAGTDPDALRAALEDYREVCADWAAAPQEDYRSAERYGSGLERVAHAFAAAMPDRT